MLIFDNPCEESCNSKTFVDIATAGRHRGLSNIYIKLNLFHQSKLGRDVELQNTHVVLFKSSRDLIPAITLSAQLGLVSQLVDWYRDATFVACGHLLIDLLPRTDDRLCYCTNTGTIPSKFHFPDGLKLINFWQWTHKISLLSKFLIVFPQISHKSLFFQSCPKEFIRVLCECIKNLRKGNLQSLTIHHMANVRSEVWLFSLERRTWKQRREILASGLGLQLNKPITPPVINHLIWYRIVCPRSCLCVQRKFDYPVC